MKNFCAGNSQNGLFPDFPQNGWFAVYPQNGWC